MNSRLKTPCLSLTLAFMSVLLLNTACNDRCERIKGARERYEIPIGNANSIVLNSPADIIILETKDTANGDLEIYAQPEVYLSLETEIKNDQVSLEVAGCFRQQKNMLVEASMVDLKSVSLNAAGEIRSEGLLNTDSLFIENNGLGDVNLHLQSRFIDARTSTSGNIILSGKTNQLFAGVLGSGEVSAFDLFADTVIIENYGSGVIEVHANKMLQVNFVNPTTVRYRGNPNIITVGGEGNLVNANF